MEKVFAEILSEIKRINENGKVDETPVPDDAPTEQADADEASDEADNEIVRSWLDSLSGIQEIVGNVR